VAPYESDFLTNYEFGWKTTPAPGLRFNGAVYQQNWKKFQFSYLGANSFTEIHNGPDARIRGVDLDLGYTNGGFSLNVAAAYTDAKMTKNLCAIDDPTYTCSTGGNSIVSPAGTRLPITPRWKLSSTARYTHDMGNAKAYGQINAAYQSSASGDVRLTQATALGVLPEFATVNLAFGVDWDKFNIELFATNVFDERGQISRFVACGQCYQRPYIVPTQPRTFGIRAGADF
jgi:outer membrane receptor for Fe3+-dicitrate